MSFKKLDYPLRNLPKMIQGTMPLITFLQTGRGIFLSSGLIDRYNITANTYYDVWVDRESKEIRLVKNSVEDIGHENKIRTAKAGGTTRGGNPRLLIRMEKLMNSLGIHRIKHAYKVIPIVSNDGNNITFSYKECLNE